MYVMLGISIGCLTLTFVAIVLAVFHVISANIGAGIATMSFMTSFVVASWARRFMDDNS